jgi:Rod binding domain-containing protein
MQISAIKPKTDTAVDASHLPLESLAGSKALTENQKITEASRQFEAILIRQFLAESQKPVVTSEFTDNSASAGIYQDFITNQMADSMSRGGGIGLAKTFERQLTHPAAPAGGSHKISHT